MSDSMYTSASGVGHSVKEDNEAKDTIDGTGLNDTNTKGGKLESVELWTHGVSFVYLFDDAWQMQINDSRGVGA